MSTTPAIDARTATFTIHTWTSDALEHAWTGTPSDDTAPYHFMHLMLEHGPRMAPGERIDVGRWHVLTKH